VVAVVDPVEEAAKQLAAVLGCDWVAKEHGEVVASQKVDVVVVASSTDTHALVTMDAARAGKAIFCEKPVDLDLAKVDAVLEAVRKHGVMLQVGFNRRFDPDFARIREAVKSGAIGDPHLVRIASRDPAPPPAKYSAVSGGMFKDMTIHDFDMARYLVGKEVVEVTTAAACRIDPAIGEAGDVDTALVTLRFEDETLCCIDNSRQAVFGYDQRVEILGSRGMVGNENRYPNSVTISGADRIERGLPDNFFMDRYTVSFEREMVAFIDALTSGKTPTVTGDDGRAALVLAIAAHRSWKEGRPVTVKSIEQGV